MTLGIRVKLADSLGSIVSAGLAAVIPIGVLSGAGSVYGLERTGVISVCLALAAYLAQVLTSVCVEAPLYGGGDRADIPTVVFAGGFLGCVLWGFGVTGSGVAVAGLFLMIPALECARASAVLQGGWRRELIVGALLAAGVAWTLISQGPVALHVGVAATVAAAMVIRMPEHWTGFVLPRGGQWWVVFETALVGSVQPVAMSVAYGGLGAGAATGLKFVLSVTNIISPVLYFLRLRLLSRRSVRDIALACVLLVLGCSAILVAQTLGVFGLMFGPAWSAVSLGMLIVGVIWKGLSAGTTMPFAALRRSGDGAVVIAVRLVVTALFIAASLIAVDAVGTVVGVLIGFAISEALSWILFEVAARRFVDRGPASRREEPA
ncbi:hypothetical protein [Propionibacterium freudenreichii]|uniref:hypothetical protein n=1 Tax=Propionibacterium freudenreichii TaxID=1744 RepID=UPI000BC2E55B|nr:hypothetical protein [Propionibacterium freudenreichii]MDK9592531.1 hypothetical protein [Propionibacterium freudenreichii]MDK9661924.1 hypothetical protein [Propionibacterium freudenreichii]WFF33825.1 hypothetical protein FAM19025_000820 [Propionibacterium freudenreichii]WFF36056.1 hypothetical protein FAM14221_000819 [Propionibacterium freudenreichii]SBN52457.1 Hypothetical protein PFR_JS8_1517 [Propionibacterium freudenreichii]